MTHKANGGNLRAAGIMLAAVLAWSAVPLVFARSSGLETPFLFNAAWRGGIIAGTLLIFSYSFRPLPQAPSTTTRTKPPGDPDSTPSPTATMTRTKTKEARSMNETTTAILKRLSPQGVRRLRTVLLLP